MICPECGSEYPDLAGGIVRCDECDVDLVDEIPEPAPTVRDLLFGSKRERGDEGPESAEDHEAPRSPGGPADLDDHEEVQVPGDPRSHALRRVHVAQTLADAHIVKDVLESHGFACVVKGEHLENLRGGIPFEADTLPSVWVPEVQAERAMRVVTDAAGGPGEAGDWICPNCDEEIEGQFTDCWQCGTPRP